ncbi:hypothetical protein FW755_08030 [Lonepinella koalarum]|uniref:hypothetical protein n=1 Tax=Lonepinella koalarum TaxID=53417 RepID=UPI0011E3E9A2|nr:hypothetical protein [Lonepinella koalarum]TYG35038.1 hypothetical protein FW755_08030 [Lonepinella koalarum]
MTSLFFFVHLAVLATLWESVNFSLRLSTIALKNSQLKNPLFIPNLIYRNLLLALLFFYGISSILLPDNVSGFLAIGIGCLFIANLKEFHYWDLLRFPALAVYYLLQLIGGMGYFYLGYCQLSQQSLLIAQGVILSYLVGLLSLYLLWQRHKFSLTK